MIDLHGVVPALTTPFDAQGALDLDAFQTLVEVVVGDGVHGVIVGGCTGESWALSQNERGALFRAAAEQVAGRVPVIAGCGAVSAREAIAKTAQAQEAGCDAVLVQPPWYVLPGERDVVEYYRRVTAAAGLPVVLYNIPRRTGVNLSRELVARLLDLPGVVALKESSKDYLLLSELLHHFGERIRIFAGYANLLGLAALASGAAGYMDSATPVLGGRSLELYRALQRNDLPAARRLQARMFRLHAGLFASGTFPATVKAALELVGRPGGWPRDPVNPLDAEQHRALRKALLEAGFDSSELAGARAGAQGGER